MYLVLRRDGAGLATSWYVRGIALTDIAGQLRQADLRSLRTYLDAVALMENHATGDVSRSAATAARIEGFWWPMLAGDPTVWAAIDELAPIPLEELLPRPRAAQRRPAPAPPRP